MAQQLSNLSEPSRQLRNNTDKNPSGHVNVVTLSSDTTYDPPPMIVVDDEEEVVEEKTPKEGEKEEQSTPIPEKRKEPTTDVYVAHVLFQQRLACRKP